MHEISLLSCRCATASWRLTTTGAMGLRWKDGDGRNLFLLRRCYLTLVTTWALLWCLWGAWRIPSNSEAGCASDICYATIRCSIGWIFSLVLRWLLFYTFLDRLLHQPNRILDTCDGCVRIFPPMISWLLIVRRVSASNPVRWHSPLSHWIHQVITDTPWAGSSNCVKWISLIFACSLSCCPT